MRARTKLLAALIGAALLTPAAASAEGWHSAQPAPPSPPEGQNGVGVPVPLGHIGEISFWAPNRGLLITAGNEAIPAGLYYYNGVSWHELSNVCGGADGRIAWAGPDDFWTISDQQTGQQTGIGTSAEADWDRSLCHFQNGQVAASYAEPIGVSNSYQQMDAAACSSPSDCWFGGERLPAGVNTGAFHLHWNGAVLSTVPSLETYEPQLEDPAHKVADIVSFRGRFYESVQIAEDDAFGSESAANPYLLHRISEGSSNPFVPLLPEGVGGSPFSYGNEGVQPWQLSAFRFAAGTNELWAFAGPDGQASGGGNARVTALQLQAGIFQQVELNDPGAAFAPGDEIAGVATEPGSEDALVSVDPPAVEDLQSASARVVRVHQDGTVEPASELPQAGEGLGHKGAAGAIACPAAGDCWLATVQGWLFHLGPDYPQDSDPNFQSLISYRPRDASIPFEPPDEAPPDDSGDNPTPIPAPAPPSVSNPPAEARAALFSHVKEKLLSRSTLAVTFVLVTKSQVRLLALHGKRSVASTKRLTLARGRHTLKLHLDPRRWPTRLDLQVKAIGAVPLVPVESSGGGPTGGPTVVSTSYHAPSAMPLSGALLDALP
jgi:hypothetical protein